jgi:hypothetical protein
MALGASHSGVLRNVLGQGLIEARDVRIGDRVGGIVCADAGDFDLSFWREADRPDDVYRCVDPINSGCFGCGIPAGAPGDRSGPDDRFALRLAAPHRQIAPVAVNGKHLGDAGR